MNKAQTLAIVIPNTALYPFIADSVRTHVDNLAQQGGVINTILIITLSLIWLMWKGTSIYLIGQILFSQHPTKPAQRRFK